MLYLSIWSTKPYSIYMYVYMYVLDVIVGVYCYRFLLLLLHFDEHIDWNFSRKMVVVKDMSINICLFFVSFNQ